ncbi:MULTISPECIES: MFS transporter [Delftia]|uniref:MFS transporter n=1 Tax=Delftia tsuruhatensis TaxID=180282 RepID=A0AAX3SNZ3_9BURK|nr:MULTISPECIES: MFS transporter [Delftia]MDH0418136.1 MFS transporter [Delftia tsuruhatensis]OJX13517.1 MAG: MFS transporter [Delftia sp. 67-8]QFS67875.1 MFS transporter [Delftia tsuruhatensis]WFF81862.1 MFS transporter [Delftia tsuruhatensis]WON89528.1 MFS transporter [Delftia sp. UGAL515B_04]
MNRSSPAPALPSPPMQATAAPVLPQSTLLLMATACGLCAGANYFNQPLLHSIAMDLGISEARASLTVTMAQVSYALGLLLLVPLGDMLERRRLVLGLMLLAALGMLASGMAHSFALLAAGTLMTGLFSVAAQVLVPMAASFAAPGASGRAVGLVMSGLLIGILASRSVAGVLSDLGGWNAVYWVGALATAGVALLLRRALPLAQPAQRIGYGAVMRSLLTLAREQPRLRSRALIGGMGFATVSVLFSTMALLLAGPGYGFGDAQIGLIGLVGVAGALMANMAGRLADRGLEQRTTLAGGLLMLAGWGALWLGGTSLWWFLAGLLIVDAALQALHISNQNVIYALAPSARSRINAVYMTGYFIGASLGSAVGSTVWLHWGWTGASVAGLALSLCTLAVVAWDRSLARQAKARA